MLPIRLVIVFLLGTTYQCLGQRPILDSATFGKWPEIGGWGITDDAKFSTYSVSDRVSGELNLTLLSNTGNWRFTARNIQGAASFSNDSKNAFFINAGDSLVIVRLGTSRVDYVPNISAYRVSPEGPGAWIAYLSKQGQKLTVRGFNANKELSYMNVQFYSFARDGKSIILDSYDSAAHSQRLSWIELSTGNAKMVWSGSYVVNFQLDDSCLRLSFIGGALPEDSTTPSLFYFRQGMNHVVCEISGDSLKKRGMILSQGTLQFSRMGDKLIFGIQAVNNKKTAVAKNESSLTVWSYKDSILQSIQRLPGYQDRQPEICQVLNIESSTIVQAQRVDEEFDIGRPFENYKLVTRHPVDAAYWNNIFSLRLLSLADGKSVPIVNKTFITLYEMSPDERFVVWFDPVNLKYWDYEISTGTIRQIGKSIPTPLYDEEEVKKGRSYNAAYGLCGWSDSDHSVYLYDKFDIWKIDLFDRDIPVNVTNGYGRSNSLVLSRLDMEHVGNAINFDDVDQILLSIYNINNKDNGLLLVDKHFKISLKDVSIGPFSYCVGRTGVLGYSQTAVGSLPVKAKGGSKYLIRRMNASNFPNLFLTDDFKHFKQLSFVEPEKKYNWMRTELMSWNNPEGDRLQGILYLPDNFDSTKKYPVLFECYEIMSNDLNDYLTPEVSDARINIPYYVSNGYLVFEPDITWHKEAMGSGFVNSVVSAVKYLSEYKWVDSTKIGFQGHSFGGWVANYIATHTHEFAAVCAASGFSDAVSGYDELGVGAKSFQGNFELGQEGYNGIGVAPWTNPGLYITNSPLFNVGNTTAPLLLMHGRNDHNVPFVQSRELYLALRRAGKRVWFLEYENAGHVLQGADAQDFSIRMKQFFDHYLKNAPAPVWMTEGIPYSQRTFDTGFEMDLSGREP